jgi:hypothetical protein
MIVHCPRDALVSVKEIFKEIEECPNYRVSNQGNVYRVLKNGRLRKLKQRKGFGEYLQAAIFSKNGTKMIKYVHRLVAKAFLSGEEKKQVNHKNGIKTDNQAINLEWVTAKENRKHALETGLAPSGSKSPNSKLTKEQVIKIFNLKGIKSSRIVAMEFNVSKPVILSIWNKKKYKMELFF